MLKNSCKKCVYQNETDLIITKKCLKMRYVSLWDSINYVWVLYQNRICVKMRHDWLLHDWFPQKSLGLDPPKLSILLWICTQLCLKFHKMAAGHLWIRLVKTILHFWLCHSFTPLLTYISNIYTLLYISITYIIK